MFLVEKIISIAIVFQTLEFLQLQKTWQDDGVFSWRLLKNDFTFLPKLFDFFLKPSHFLLLLYVRMACAILLLMFSSWLLALILFMTSLLISARWRGAFNGGSDSMTLLILLALTVALFFKSDPRVVLGCLWYIAIQASLSYFISGLWKLKSQNWRQGLTLPGIFNSSIYISSPLLNFVSSSGPLCLLLSWAIIAFELSFPLCFLNPSICFIFIGLALLFHLANFYIFGLNRFIFSWAAAYPALFYLSKTHH